jgi:TonB family protein
MTRRSIVAAISILVHVVVVFAAMTADMWRPITEWPTPRSAMAYVEDVPRQVHLEDIELSRRASQRSLSNTAPAEPAHAAELAPVTEPRGLLAEIAGGRNTEIPVCGCGVDGALVSASGSAFGEPVMPPPPPQLHQGPVRLHSGIKAPQRIVNVAPAYPLIARNAHVEGLIIIEATIDENGNVTRTQILRSIPLLDEAALAAVRQWKFTPTQLNGVAVPIVMTITVNFKLDQ